MLDMQTIDSYFIRLQNTRVVIRQATCINGFCLIIDDTWKRISYFRKVLSYRNMESKCVDTNKDAIIVIRRDLASIICILVNIDFVNQRVLDDIENSKVPYVAYTEEKKVLHFFKRKYPHMNIMLSTSKIALIDSLGVQ